MSISTWLKWKKDDRSTGYKTAVSREARICTECPLPAKSCKPLSCKRYKEEMQKIKAEEKGDN